MKKVPCMKNPKVEDILIYREKIPCFDKVEKIITEEITKGNKIVHIGDAGFLPDETYIVIDFADKPKSEYPGMQTAKWYGEEYKYFSFSDNKGAVSFNFYKFKEQNVSNGSIDLVIDRNSVCMGDDVEAHAVKYTFPNDATYEDLFEKIINDRYLPSVAGNNVVWVLGSDEAFCIFSYFTRTGKMNPGLSKRKLSEICKNGDKLIFKYFSSPMRWKKCIERSYNGDGHAMYKDGWLEELKYCEYVETLGNEN